MRQLIKRRMRSYVHSTGLGVRGYLGESPGVTYTPTQSNNQIDQTHKAAMIQVAVDAIKGSISGAASGAVGGSRGRAIGAAIGATTKGAESIITNCVNCHQKKN